VHEVAPGFGASLPGVGVGYGVDEGHDAVAYEDHGGEVLCAGWVGEEHSGLEGVWGVGCCLCVDENGRSLREREAGSSPSATLRVGMTAKKARAKAEMSGVGAA
jgi:hypothetical protein